MEKLEHIAVCPDGCGVCKLMANDVRVRIAELEAAITEFSKATSMKDGPSLAMQRHEPTWKAWKKLCERLAP